MSRLETQQKLLHPGQDEIVPFGVEMRQVVGSLEIMRPEGAKAHEDAAAVGGVIYGNPIFAADFFHSLDSLRVHGLRYGPGGKEAYSGRWEFALQARAEQAQPGTEEFRIHAVPGHQHGIVVAADDDDVIYIRVREFRVALVHGAAELIRLPLVGQAVAVPPPVVVLHVVFLSEFVVPGFFYGAAGVLDIAVAEDNDFLFVKRGGTDFFRRIEFLLGHPQELLLREGVQRQQQGEYEQNSLHSKGQIYEKFLPLDYVRT